MLHLLHTPALRRLAVALIVAAVLAVSVALFVSAGAPGDAYALHAGG